MRLLLTFALLAGSALTLAAAEPFPADDRAAVPIVGAVRAICQDAGVTHVDDARGAAMKRLDELPPADHLLTVLRTEDGCIKPVIVRHGIGAPGQR